MKVNTIELVNPLSSVQASWLNEARHPADERLDCGQFVCLLRGAPDVRTLELAWRRVVAAHSILRTAFVWKRVKKPLQVVHHQVETGLDYQDWRGLPAGRPEKGLCGRVWSEIVESLAPERAPLARLSLCRMDEADRLILSYSRLVLDRLSLGVILRDLLAAYDDLCNGQVGPPPPNDSFQTHLSWLASCDWDDAERFWRETLAGIPDPPAPFADLPRPPNGAPQTQTARLRADLWQRLQPRQSGGDLCEADFIMGVLALVLARYTDADEIVIGVTDSGRPPGLAAAAMAGTFMNVLPVRLRVAGNASALDWLEQAAAARRAVSSYGYCSISQIRQWAAVPESSPLFQACLDGGAALTTCQTLQGAALTIEEGQVIEPASRAVDVKMIPGAGLALELTFNTSEPEAAARFAGHLNTMIEAIAAAPDRRLDSLPLLTQHEMRQVVEEWNQTASAYPRHLCLNQLFEEQAAERPDAVALTTADAQLTYRAVDERANQLAHHLRRLGVGPDVLVGVYLDRSVEMIVAILGILKAGGAYVPFDLAYPLERLAILLEDTHCPVILTREALLYDLSALWSQLVCVDTGWDEVATQPRHQPSQRATPDNLAYVMYTSGSTGKPKGVCVTHRNVARLVRGNFFIDLSPAEVLMALAPVSFDASTLEIWGALLNGARLVVMPAELASLADIGEALQNNQVTTLWLTAGLFHLMVAERLEALRGVRQLLAGGDVLSPHLVGRALAGLPDCTIINGYGPTENTTFTCCHRMSDSSVVQGSSVPIGTPIGNTQAYLLDGALRPVPVGVTGTLYTGGDGVGRGYFERPDLTAERFLPNPFGDVPETRLYNTGDLCRYRPDGVIEFVGRRDQQVKIRGYRVELGEIDAMLNQMPGIREALAVVKEKSPGDKRLVAYLVTDQPAVWTAPDLSDHLQAVLPDYMIPTHIVVLESLPLTANGKIDRSALPSPEDTEPALAADFVAPRTEVEEVLAQLWAEVLQAEKLGIEAHFFHLGGQSLTAIQLISRVRDVFQIDIPLQCLFEAPTVADFAARLMAYEQTPGQIAAIARLRKEVNTMTDGEVRSRMDEETRLGEVEI